MEQAFVYNRAKAMKLVTTLPDAVGKPTVLGLHSV